MAENYRSIYEMPPLYASEELRPTIGQWIRHGILFLITFITATIAGLIFPFGSIQVLERIPYPTHFFDYFFFLNYLYTNAFAIVAREIAANPAVLTGGLLFSISLLAILTAHEFGHYIACRIYGVKATLPFFIPLPFLSPAGTLGAVIKIQSPMPTQRAVFDIGVAGPLAGFAVIVPVTILGLATMEYAPPGGVPEIVFTDPLLPRLLGAIMGVDPTLGVVNPFYSAAWVGLLVTALNLLPAGQLDGGHAVFSVFGERAHSLIGRAAFVAMVIFTVLGWQLYGSPGTLIFTILLGVLLRFPHPQPLFDEPLDQKRKIIAVVTLIVFVLSFMPFPIQINMD